MTRPKIQKKIIHLTTVHSRNDPRILLKQVLTLAQFTQWSLTLVVADGKGSAIHKRDGSSVAIQDIGKLPWGRPGRMIFGAWRAFREIRRLQADVVHFHDPELIPTSIALKLLGYKVIYDVHEDVPRDILDKPWLPRILQKPIAWIMTLVEWFAAKVFDAIVPATPKIAERFPAGKTVVVQNFPILLELVAPNPVPYLQRLPAFAYVGVIAETRGAREMVQAMGCLDERMKARLELAGEFGSAGLEVELQAIPGWASANIHGHISRPEVTKLLGDVKAGLVVLHPTAAYPDAYPIKMFEYMAAGIPVIASDFPLWRKIIENAGCGLLVDPLNPKAIAACMRWILENPDEAEAIGQRGRRAVEHIYNWECEATKLVALYERLLAEAPSDVPSLRN